MKEKYISRLSLIINAIIFTGVGLTLTFIPTKSLGIFHFVVSMLISLLGLVSFIFNIIKTKKKMYIFISISTFSIGMFFYANPTKFLVIFPLVFGLYMLINGIIKLVAYLIYKGDKLKGTFATFVNSLIDFIFSFIMLSNPSKNIRTLTIVLGIYLILFGLNYLYDLIKDLFPKLFSRKKRRIRITLPIILSTMIPYQVYTKINTLLDKYVTPVHINHKNTSGNVDLEVFIHVKDTSIGRFGHADFCFEGKVYSYGCYDEQSKKLFETIGDGTLFTIEDKEKYLKFCTSHSKKTIFVFGISLTDKQKEAIRKEINKVREYAYRWYSDQELDKKNTYNDYASILYKETKAEFYKFSKGKWKTYFLFTTNCVKLVDKVLGATGSDILKVNGLITPGAYYNYLDNEFKLQNSNVISKTIYINKKRK